MAYNTVHRILFSVFFLMWTLKAIAQTPQEIKVIKSELRDIFDSDQNSRRGKESAELIAYNDSCNLVRVERLIEKYGWMGMSMVGTEGNITLWVVIQHADLHVQEKYLPLLQQSVKIGESRPGDLALLQDRILMRQGKKQLYGSQVVFNKITGTPEIYPIEDEKNVNIRRIRVGLNSLEKYAKEFGILYVLPGN